MSTLTEVGAPEQAGARDTAARPLWNPYAAGVVLGLVLLASYLIAGRGLGATGAFASVASWIAGLISSEHALANPVHAKFWNEGAPLASFLVFLLGGVFVGALGSGWQARRLGFRIERGPRMSDGQRLALAFAGGALVAFGAKIAKGCTSGQALSGGAMLNAGSLVFMLAVFAAAYALSYFARKEWL